MWTRDHIRRVFGYHEGTAETGEVMELVRASFARLAYAITLDCPENDEKESALQSLSIASMQVMASIAREEPLTVDPLATVADEEPDSRPIGAPSVLWGVSDEYATDENIEVRLEYAHGADETVEARPFADLTDHDLAAKLMTNAGSLEDAEWQLELHDALIASLRRRAWTLTRERELRNRLYQATERRSR